MYQDIAWYVTVVLVTVVALGFVFVARRASEGSDYEPIRKKSALTDRKSNRKRVMTRPGSSVALDLNCAARKLGLTCAHVMRS